MAVRTGVREQIKKLIIDGAIPEGSLLIERELGERLGVSRIPVREALLQLTTEGFLIESTGKGLLVRSYSFQEIAELYLYREALDGMAARLFTERSTDSEREYLRMVYQIMEDRIEDKFSPFWARKDVEFHAVIIKGCRNEWIAQSLESVYQVGFFLRSKYITIAMKDYSKEKKHAIALEVLDEHKKVLDAILSGNGDAAETAVRRSDQTAYTRMLANYASYNLKELAISEETAD